MEVFSVVAPSVVTIQDIATVQGRDVEEGVGSGFVWDKYGHIVTNSHVINQVAKDQTGTQVCGSRFGCLRTCPTTGPIP